MSFFRKFRPKDNDEYIKREREYNKKKKEDFLQARVARKEIEDSPQVDNDPSTPQIDDSQVFTGHAKTKPSFTERVEAFKIKRKLNKEENEYKKIKKVQEREEKEESGRKERERKIFGKELTEEEREKIKAKSEEIRLQKEIKQAKRRKQVKEGYATFESGLKTVNKYRSKLSNIGPKFGAGLDFGPSNEGSAPIGNTDIVNVFKGKKLANDALSFDLNFGNLLAGKKGNKKLKKHPLSI